MLRRALTFLRSLPGVVFGLVFVVLFAMFASNDNWDKDPSAPRGDGVYRPILARGDGHLMYLMARSIVLDQDVDYDDDLAEFGDPFHQPRTVTGRKGVPHPIGPALIWSPLLGVAHVTSKIPNLFGADIADHGYTMWHQRIVFSSSVFFALGAAILAWLVLRRWAIHMASGLYAIVAVVFGTALTYLVTYMPSYAHAMDSFVCAAFLAYWALTYGRWTRRRFVIIGSLLGVCALVRITGFSLGVVLALEIAIETVRRARARDHLRAVVAPALLGGLALVVAIVVFSPQMLAWKYMYGEYLVSPMGPRFMRLGNPRIAETLFSSRNGWLSTHPIAYLGVLGLAFVPRSARIIALGFGIVTLVQVYVNSCVFDWWAGASFGQRRMCSVTLVLVVGLGSLIAAGHSGLRARDRSRGWFRAYWGLVTIVLAWFVTWNMNFVGIYRDSIPSSSSRPMCCRGVPRPMAAIAQPIYDAIGNPFALPASLVFAWRHDVPLKRWDEAVGHDADEPDLTLYNNGAHVTRTHTWNLPGRGFTPYIITGLGASQSEAGKSWRWSTTERARWLVPLMVPESHTFSVPVFPNVAAGQLLRVRVGFDDDVYRDEQLPAGWNQVTFTVDDPGVGMHEMWIEAVPHPHAGPPTPPLPKGTSIVGAAIGSITIGYPRGAAADDH